MRYLLIVVTMLLQTGVFAQQDTAMMPATITNATVYYGYGAELTHKAKVAVNKNTKFIVVDKLSTQLDINSLQINCPETVSLLSQQFVVYHPAAKPIVNNLLTKKIMDTIKLFNKQMAVLKSKIDIEQDVLNKTNKLIETTIATSANKTTLTAEVLKLIDYNSAKIEKNKTAIFLYEQQIILIQEQINDASERLVAMQNANNKTAPTTDKAFGRLIMQVVCRAEQIADIALSYYTNNAGWQPIYDIRVNAKTNDIKLLYKASVIQNTGIDWLKTNLILSTGTPNFTTTAPLLNPLYLQYYVPQLQQALSGKAAGISINGYSVNTVQSINFYKADDKKEADSYSVETITPSTIENFTTLKQGMLNTNFEIDLPYDVLSNGLAHSINIKEANMKSTLKNYAVPKLDADAYLLAEIIDWQNLDLIPGNANIIMDDTYIGKSFIDPNTTADTLNLSLGKDKRIAVKRNIVKDATTTKTKDAFSKQIFTYEVVVKNNKTTTTSMLLKDQHPLSNVNEVEVMLVDDGAATVNAETGVLTWKLILKPGEVKKVRFSFSIKYPKDKKFINLK